VGGGSKYRIITAIPKLVPDPALATANRVLPSPSKSPIATENWASTCCKIYSFAKEFAILKLPLLAVLRYTETLSEPAFSHRQIGLAIPHPNRLWLLNMGQCLLAKIYFARKGNLRQYFRCYWAISIYRNAVLSIISHRKSGLAIAIPNRLSLLKRGENLVQNLLGQAKGTCISTSVPAGIVAIPKRCLSQY